MSKKSDVKDAEIVRLKQKIWGGVSVVSLAACLVGLGVVVTLSDRSSRYAAGEVANILVYTCIVLAIVSIISIIESRAKVRVLAVVCFLLIITILVLARAMYWVVGI